VVGEDFAIPAFALLFLMSGLAGVALARRPAVEVRIAAE
jgi:hypothetical protein